MELPLLAFKHFPDYELLDSGAGFRLERWGSVVLARPDPQTIWARHEPESVWKGANAIFENDRNEKGGWKIMREFSHPWNVRFNDIVLKADLTPFKHTGIFAEQAAQWEWMGEKLKAQRAAPNDKNEKPKILNLFAYTGAATMVLAKAGCFVTHVDASKPSIAWAKSNHAANRLPADSVRWILDDVVKFIKREVKRGSHYDGIIMDPPAFGHGPQGTVWKFNDHLPALLSDCVQLLSPQALFLLINAYATNSSAIALGNLMQDALNARAGSVESGELCLAQRDGRLLSTGIFSRWFGK